MVHGFRSVSVWSTGSGAVDLQWQECVAGKSCKPDGGQETELARGNFLTQVHSAVTHQRVNPTDEVGIHQLTAHVFEG